MNFRRKSLARVTTTGCGAMLCLLALICGTSVVKAQGAIPVEGGWVATTSAGLPVSFEVKEGNVLNAHFRFNWGFCGNFESRLSNTNPIDATGHWSFQDPRGQTIEATFVAPDRAEGSVVAVERQLPGCPATQATFVAAPGEIPPYVEPEVFAVQNKNTGRLSKRPHDIVLRKDRSFSFHALKWQTFGARIARATGKAEIHRENKVWSPQASLRLSSLVEAGPGKRIYSVMHYVLHGPLPRGMLHHNFRLLG
jgi:hypothetical protein